MFVAKPGDTRDDFEPSHSCLNLQLRGDLQQRLKLLVEDCSTDFWRSDRVLVQAENQLASFKDGKIRLCRSWTSWSAPEIYSVQPLAVVAGQETTITLRGHNLAAPGTKILCAYGGKYTSQVVLQAGNANVVHSESMLIDHRVQRFNFPGGPANVLGRCFIEVEHGFKGDSFPIIVADSAICRELQSLECEMEDEFAEDKSCSITSGHSEGHLQDYSRVRIKEEVINFLNELGWLFQRKHVLPVSTVAHGGESLSLLEVINFNDPLFISINIQGIPKF